MAVAPFFKKAIYRSEDWLEAVRSIECCVLCGKYGVQSAHRNEGKGLGLKTDDCLTAAICETCHHGIDNGPDHTRDERRGLMDKAILLTLVELCRLGRIMPMKRRREMVST